MFFYDICVCVCVCAFLHVHAQLLTETHRKISTVISIIYSMAFKVSIIQIKRNIFGRCTPYATYF